MSLRAWKQRLSRWQKCGLLGLLLTVGIGLPARAQSALVTIDVQNVPLAEALRQLEAQTGIRLVYAQRLIAHQRSSCRYQGDRIEEALACLLQGTSLRARRIRAGQYVLVATRASRRSWGPATGLLSGFVLDAQTGEVLPGAHVYLPDLRRGAITNAAGYFALPTLARAFYRVRVSYLGYAALDTILWAGGEPQTLWLQPVTLGIGVVRIDASRLPLEEQAATTGTFTLPVPYLERLPSFPGEQDLFQVLQWLPGVQRSGEVSGGLLVQGGTPDQNLYLLDGAPIYHPWHAFSLISTFQTETFKGIRLYQGAFPASHGGRLSAVLEAEMRDGNREQPRTLLGLSPLSARFIIESPITQGSSFMMAGRRSYLDQLIGREHPVEDENGRRDTLRTGYYFYDVSAKLAYRPGVRHRLSLSYYEGGDDLDLRLPFDFSLDFSSWLRPADLFFEVDQRWGNRLISFRYQYLPTRRFFVSTVAYLSGYRAREAFFVKPTGSAAVASRYTVHLEDVGVRVEANHYATLTHETQLGVQLVRRTFRSTLNARVQRAPRAVDTLVQRSRQQALEATLYAQHVWRPTTRWEGQVGLRLSRFEALAVEWEPRLSMRYSLSPDQVVLRISIGRYVQYLHQLRDRFSYVYDVVSTRWIPAGAGVRPAVAWQGATELEARPHPWLTLRTQLYYRRQRYTLLPQDVYQTKDGLEGPGIETGVLLGQYTPAQARAFGIEALVRIDRDPWQLWVSYRGGRSLNRAPALGEQRDRPARFDVPKALNAFIRYTRSRWEVMLAGELRSGYPTTVPVARYELSDPLEPDPISYLYRPDINNGRLPPYWRVDARVAYRFGWLGARWEVELYVYNLFNHRNVIDRRYEPTPTGVRVIDRRGLPLLPLLELQMEL
ncbi:TonB-dependent receptor [Rhodothermus profundi]|uniref:Outer membrane receptor proteins, mostly Fe transport n=1 Tax=Rhodothermus profundi TaxID=633813 RepID=A0A1M6TE39_9BACT|nr:TonB-dependent receptor [Rhodothermus profundi]SHK55159.1 Outer membrane receptor proteins, mostly Fe transport [Rhodothermus profundi]